MNGNAYVPKVPGSRGMIHHATVLEVRAMTVRLCSAPGGDRDSHDGSRFIKTAGRIGYGRMARQGAHRRRTNVQPLVGASCGTVYPPVHRNGLRLFRLLAAAHQSAWHHQVRRVSQGHELVADAVHYDLRLVQDEPRLDVSVVLVIPRFQL